VAARHTDALDRHPDRDAMLGDEHQLVVGEHFLYGDGVTGFLRAMHGDDALPAALLNAVLIDRRALAHALLRHHEEVGLALDHDHADHLVVRPELDPLHAGRVATHLARILFVEANRQAVPPGQHHV